MQTLNGTKLAYVFSVLPYILVLSNKSHDHVSAHLMRSLPKVTLT